MVARTSSGTASQHGPRPDRAASYALLEEPVTRARYVNAARAELLAKLKVTRVRDLLTCYPHRYLDMSTVVSTADAPLGQTVTVVGTLDSVKVKRPRPRLSLVEAALVDESGVLIATWFSQPWVAKKLKEGMRVALSGKVEFSYGYKRMNSPFSDVLSEGAASQDGPAAHGVIIPIHRATAGLTPSWMRRLISAALADLDNLPDPLPVDLRLRYRLMDRAAALRAIHFPRNVGERDQARRRLAYEEVLCLQLHLLMRRNEELTGVEPVAHAVDGPALAALRDALPFQLTDEQQEAVAAILSDMAAPRCMNRLVQGDVGTGKTVVAAHALAVAADSGCQAAMMAPTGVLASQYGAKLGPLLDKAGVTWALLTGATPASQRKRILHELAAGELQVLFGTHALLEDDVRFARLSLVVIDEQQRFGVGQRSKLLSKGPGADLLTMTATPIPRSLALTLYGDLECSYIRRKPRAGAAIATKVLPKRRRAAAYQAIAKALKAGEQAYIVCPLVGAPKKKRPSPEEEQEAAGRVADQIARGVDVSDATAAENLAAALRTREFPSYAVGLLTGRMKPAEKEQVMSDFAAHRIDVLVSTTVIEVGVDVPNATVMLVEDAELFGLAQLHQLRGRVGRGERDGTVYLLADPKSEEAQARLEAIAATEDGLALAELDLASRHEGDVLGFRQSGASTLKLIDIGRDRALIERAHEDAHRLLADDPRLQAPDHALLAAELRTVFSQVDDEAVVG